MFNYFSALVVLKFPRFLGSVRGPPEYGATMVFPSDILDNSYQIPKQEFLRIYATSAP